MSGIGGAAGRYSRQNELDSRSLAGLAIEMEPSSQMIRDDGMGEMQAEAGAAVIAACREEGNEGIAPDIKAHATAIVRKKDVDCVIPGRL